MAKGADRLPDGRPYGSGTTVSSSLTRTEQRPPITSRFMPSLSWPLVTSALMGRTSDPHVTTPDALNEPLGKPGNVTRTLPVLGLVPTVPEA
jgi:hypothetical protein